MPVITARDEFDAQVDALMRAVAGMPDVDADEVRELVAPLRDRVAGLTIAEPEAGVIPFVLVVTRDVIPIDVALEQTSLSRSNLPGFVDHSFEEGALERFVATGDVSLPDPRAYLLIGVERGEEFCDVVPREAMETIGSRGRTPLTIEEGISLIRAMPEILEKNKCFSLGGSRSGDRRVPALWISKRAPKLGWCWEGNPHTWLGMASATNRVV